MGMPDECSIFCKECGCFNIQYGSCIIIENVAWCNECLEELGVKEMFNKIKRKLTKERKR